MSTIFNSRDPLYKSPFGAVRRGEPVLFTLRVPQSMGCTTPCMLLARDGEAPQTLFLDARGAADGCDVFSLTVRLPKAGLYWYYFDLYVGYQKLFRTRGGAAAITTGQGESWQLTVFEAEYETPDALRGGVLYQIFPDRFCEGVPNKPMPFADRVYRADKNGEPYFWPTEQREGYLNLDYFGGDLAGITQKLPYLADLGVTMLYLNPIFEAHANHRYNTADYRKVDPLLGTEEDFAALCAAAKRCGIGIILDGVFSHTGSDSVYFNREGRYNSRGAYHCADSPYRSWYDFSAQYPCGYRSWWGFETLPEVREMDPSYLAFICGEGGVIDHWMELGASGFRLDVADELPDVFIEHVRAAVKRHGSDKYLLGEVWEDATTKQAYGVRRTYLLGKGLDAVMNYPFRTAVLAFLRGGDAGDAAESILTICENYPAPALNLLMNFLSTHDTVRGITALAGEPCEGHDRYWQSGRRLSPAQYERGRKLLLLAYAMLYTLPGIPCVYYGDEICMQGYKDPFNRAYYDWHSTEGRVRPVLHKLAQLRSGCPAFADGDLFFEKAQGGVLQYVRRSAAHAAAVCINRTGYPVDAVLLDKTCSVPPYDFAVVTK